MQLVKSISGATVSASGVQLAIAFSAWYASADAIKKQTEILKIQTLLPVFVGSIVFLVAVGGLKSGK